MKWKISWLANQPNQEYEVNETLTFSKEMFRNVSNINSVSPVSVNGLIYLQDNLVNISLTFKGTLYLPCVLSNEEGEYPFTFDINECLDESHREVADYKADYIDLLEITWQQLIVEAPTRFVKNEVETTNGQSWQLLTEEEYRMSIVDEVDPRFSKLQDLFKENKEE
ncbi:MAG: YceD family protein [Bacilli bacterium]